MQQNKMPTVEIWSAIMRKQYQGSVNLKKQEEKVIAKKLEQIMAEIPEERRNKIEKRSC